MANQEFKLQNGTTVTLTPYDMGRIFMAHLKSLIRDEVDYRVTDAEENGNIDFKSTECTRDEFVNVVTDTIYEKYENLDEDIVYGETVDDAIFDAAYYDYEIWKEDDD